jgi:cell division transport system permease protein
MSFSTDTKRIIRWGLINFYRNTTVSITSILMMTVTLMVIGTIIFLNAILGFSLAQIQNKVDVNVYFYPNVAQVRIDEVQNMIQQLPEVAHVEYVSEDQVLADFKARHAQDALTLQGLEELGTNPLGGMLNIRAREAGQYESIAKVIDSSMSGQTGRSTIYKVNYAQNKQIIERLTDIMHSVQRVGVAITIFFIIISFLITFNTIRLAIYMARDEIVNMRLVGAENKYIQGPFMVEGIVYGAVSSVIALILFYPITLWLTQNTQVFFEGMSIVKYYSDNFFMLFLILMSVGVLLGIVSAWFAIRKYLKR